MPPEHEPPVLAFTHVKKSPVVLAAIRGIALAAALSLQGDATHAQTYLGNAKHELQTVHFKNDLSDAELIIANKFAIQFASLEQQAGGKIAVPSIQKLQQEIAILTVELEALLCVRLAMQADSRNADSAEASRARRLKERADTLKEFLLPDCTVAALEVMLAYKKIDASMFPILQNLHTAFEKPDTYKKEIAGKALQELRSLEIESYDALRAVLSAKLGYKITSDVVIGARKKFLDDQHQYWAWKMANAEDET